MKQVKFNDIKTALLPKSPHKSRLYLDSVVIQDGIILYTNSVTGVIIKNRVTEDAQECEYKVVIPRSAVKELIQLHKNLDIKITKDSVLYFDNNSISMNGISVDISNAKYPFVNVYQQFDQYNSRKITGGTSATINPLLLDIISKAIKLNPEIERLKINLYDSGINSTPVKYTLGDIEIYIMQYLK